MTEETQIGYTEIEEPDPLKGKVLAYSTAYDQLDVHIVQQEGQPTQGVPESASRIVATPLYRFRHYRERLDYAADITTGQLAANLVAAGGGNWYKRDTNEPVIDMRLDLFAQALVYAFAEGNNQQPIFHIDNETLLNTCYPYYRQGLFNEDYPYEAQDGTPAANLTEALNAVDWQDEGIGTNDHYFEKLKVIFYYLGKEDRKVRPKFNTTIRSYNVQTLDRTVWAMYVTAAASWAPSFLIGSLNSVRAMIGAALSDESSRNEDLKDLGDALNITQTFLADLLMQLVRPTKAVGTLIAGHVELPQTTLFLDTYYLSGAAGRRLIKILSNENITYKFPSRFTSIERQMWGGGLYQRNNDTVEFFNLYSIALAPADFLTHGTTGWALGRELELTLNYVQGMKNWWKPFKSMFEYMQTGEQLRLLPIYKELVVDFSLTKNINGMAEPGVYRAERYFFAHDVLDGSSYVMEDNDITRGRSIINMVDPTAVDEFARGHGITQLGVREAWMGMFINFYLIPLFPDHFDSDDYLHYYVKWTDDEKSALIYFGLNFGLTYTLNWETNRWTSTRTRYMTFNHVHDSKVSIGIMTSTSNQLRWGNLANPSDWVISPLYAIKYDMALFGARNPQVQLRFYSGPRPTADQLKGTTVYNLNERSVLNDILAMSNSAVAKTKEVETSKITKEEVQEETEPDLQEGK